MNTLTPWGEENMCHMKPAHLWNPLIKAQVSSQRGPLTNIRPDAWESSLLFPLRDLALSFLSVLSFPHNNRYQKQLY